MRKLIFRAFCAAFLLACGEAAFSQEQTPVDTTGLETRAASQIDSLRKQVADLTERLGSLEKEAEKTEEEKPVAVSISLGAARTELGNAAVRTLLEIGKSTGIFQERFIANAIPTRQLGFWFNSAPDVSIETGSGDAFNNIVAKYEGDFAFFKFDKVDGLYEPNIHRVIHLVPFHAGLETNGQFSSFNLLAEIGYNPLIQYVVSKKGKSDFLLRSLQVAAYFQGGYKFAGTGDTANGGQLDESAEQVSSGLFRFKARAKLAPVLYQDKKTGVGIGLKGDGTFWYDFLNRAVYYKVDASVSLLIGGNRSIDFTYQKGSGAPNFNQGDQWSANLNLKF